MIVQDPNAGPPSWDHINDALQMIAVSRGHFAGYPLPMDDHDLVVAKQFPFPEIEKINERKKPPVDPEFEGERLVNRWHSLRLGRDVMIVERKNGTRYALQDLPSSFYRASQIVQTAHVAIVWKMEAEMTALQKLAELIDTHPFKSYFITGVFAETSKRSGVTYLFRKLRPTLALRTDPDRVRTIAALCLHPIAYYADSYAGAMVPTDDVIAHLMLMRADEHLFWRRANQHPAWSTQSGI